MAFAFRGNAWQIGFGKQSAEGTLINPTVFPRWLQGTTMDPDAKVTEEYEGDGSIDISFLNKEMSMWKGKVVMYPRATDLGLFVNGVMGTSSDTVKSAPGSGTLANATSGGTFPAGTFHSAFALLYGKTAGPLIADASTTTTTAVSTLTWSSLPTDADATGVRVYYTAAGGSSGVYTQYQDFPYTSGVTTSVTLTSPTGTAVIGTQESNTTSGKLHLFKPQTVLDFHTVEFGQTDTTISPRIKLQIADSLFYSFTLEGDAGKPLKLTVEVYGKYSQVVSALQALSLDSGKPLLFSNSTFNVDGVITSRVNKFKLTYALTIPTDLIFTHIYPESFLMERRKITADFQMLFADATKFNSFLSGGTYTNPSAGVVMDSAAIATGTLDCTFLANGTDNSNAFGMSIPNLAYQPKGPTPELDGKPFYQPVSGFGTKSGASLVTMQLRNGQSAAY